VLYACVKVLLPMACVLLLGAALWQLLVPDINFANMPRVPVPWADYNPFSAADWSRGGGMASLITQIVLAAIGVAGFGAIVAWILYAAATGRNLKQRLTDPSLIAEVETA
jgi:hypothetical protein